MVNIIQHYTILTIVYVHILYRKHQYIVSRYFISSISSVRRFRCYQLLPYNSINSLVSLHVQRHRSEPISP